MFPFLSLFAEFWYVQHLKYFTFLTKTTFIFSTQNIEGSINVDHFVMRLNNFDSPSIYAKFTLISFPELNSLILLVVLSNFTLGNCDSYSIVLLFWKFLIVFNLIEANLLLCSFQIQSRLPPSNSRRQFLLLRSFSSISLFPPIRYRNDEIWSSATIFQLYLWLRFLQFVWKSFQIIFIKLIFKINENEFLAKLIKKHH